MALLAFLICPLVFGVITFFVARSGSKAISAGIVLGLMLLFSWNASQFEWSWNIDWLGNFFWGYCVALPGLIGAIIGGVLGWRAFVYETNKAQSKPL